MQPTVLPIEFPGPVATAFGHALVIAAADGPDETTIGQASRAFATCDDDPELRIELIRVLMTSAIGSVRTLSCSTPGCDCGGGAPGFTLVDRTTGETVPPEQTDRSPLQVAILRAVHAWADDRSAEAAEFLPPASTADPMFLIELVSAHTSILRSTVQEITP